MTKAWLQAFRMRTLPLAASSVLMGNILAFISDNNNSSSFVIFILTLLTAFELQVLSNLANDYGDFVKGTDNDQRLGTPRALQSGALTLKQMRKMMVVFVLLALTTGFSLLFFALKAISPVFMLLFALGLIAIAAAIKYTVGKSAYGYRGLGDIAVFLFFGLFAVLGSAYLQIGYLEWQMLLPTCATGLLAVAVLDVNNIRDIENDRASGKITIPVRLGAARAKKYHVIIVSLALLFLLIFSLSRFSNVIDFTYLLAFPLIIANTLQVWKLPPSPAYNGLLKQLSLSILLLTLLFGVSNYLSFVFAMLV